LRRERHARDGRSIVGRAVLRPQETPIAGAERDRLRRCRRVEQLLALARRHQRARRQPLGRRRRVAPRQRHLRRRVGLRLAAAGPAPAAHRRGQYHIHRFRQRQRLFPHVGGRAARAGGQRRPAHRGRLPQRSQRFRGRVPDGRLSEHELLPRRRVRPRWLRRDAHSDAHAVRHTVRDPHAPGDDQPGLSGEPEARHDQLADHRSGRRGDLRLRRRGQRQPRRLAGDQGVGRQSRVGAIHRGVARIISARRVPPGLLRGRGRPAPRQQRSPLRYHAAGLRRDRPRHPLGGVQMAYLLHPGRGVRLDQRAIRRQADRRGDGQAGAGVLCRARRQQHLECAVPEQLQHLRSLQQLWWLQPVRQPERGQSARLQGVVRPAVRRQLEQHAALGAQHGALDGVAGLRCVLCHQRRRLRQPRAAAAAQRLPLGWLRRVLVDGGAQRGAGRATRGSTWASSRPTPATGACATSRRAAAPPTA